MKLISNVKIVYSVLILFFISLFILQQVYAQLELLNKKIGKVVYPSFNHLSLFQLIPYTENDHGSLSKLDDTTIFSVTLYPNMSSLADTRVYTNISSLGQ